MHEHVSRRAARRHDLGLAFAGIAAAAAAQGAAQPRPAPAADPRQRAPLQPAAATLPLAAN
ncbi:hypothetical protein LK542_22395 [Massilia sp. IC2-477]|uniref:hypothetical protein n=1 Tax=unclassified Massilia TaxID=2609279 RepID=UPI001D114A79|nr:MULTISPECIES: hypothetical protein [unclassified Massilia]MCC2958365.1 hypothetical protein [Massilia sp. IC2-477]MCC2974283.1 hypothetical protein [Massilia sp. IC2-476]